VETLIKEYRFLLLSLKKDGRTMAPKQRRIIITRLIRLEKIIVKKAMKMILSGNLSLDISQFPPRIQRILQKVRNTVILRKVSVLLSQELDTHAHELQLKHEETQKRLNLTNEMFSSRTLNKERNGIGHLVKLQRTEDENTNHGKKMLEKIKKTFQRS
jgi:hypothetical protein